MKEPDCNGLDEFTYDNDIDDDGYNLLLLVVAVFVACVGLEEQQRSDTDINGSADFGQKCSGVASASAEDIFRGQASSDDDN
jgi:hypothetical protein